MGEYVLAQAIHSIYYTEYCLASLNKLRRANNAFITQQYNSITFRPSLRDLMSELGTLEKTRCLNADKTGVLWVLIRTYISSSF